jgi:hypothetical protein
VETDHGKLATERQLSWCLVIVRAVSGEALVLATVLTMGSPPPSNNLTQGALIWRVDGVSLESNGG